MYESRILRKAANLIGGFVKVVELLEAGRGERVEQGDVEGSLPGHQALQLFSHPDQTPAI